MVQERSDLKGHPDRGPRPRLDGFSYSDPETEAVVRATAVGSLSTHALGAPSLPARGDAFVWAFLRSEVALQAAMSDKRQRDHMELVLEQTDGMNQDIHEEWSDKLRAFAPIVIDASSVDKIVLSVSRGSWPARTETTIAFGIGATGVSAQVAGFPREQPRFPMLNRRPRNIDEAKVVARDAALAAVEWLEPFQGAFGGPVGVERSPSAVRPA